MPVTVTSQVEEMLRRGPRARADACVAAGPDEGRCGRGRRLRGRDRRRLRVSATFLPAYDARRPRASCSSCWCRSSVPFSEVVAALPKPTLIHRVVPVPVGAQGHGHAGAQRALRRCGGRSDRRHQDVFDERGWVQVLPDQDEPLIHVYAEGTPARSRSGSRTRCAACWRRRSTASRSASRAQT